MPKVIDLFSGVGGLSLGSIRAGFELAGAVELDPIALRTHQLNFPLVNHLQYDISKLSFQEIAEQLKLKSDEVSGIIGGPPCQGFSSIGKKNEKDPRNKLFQHFFRLVSEVNPAFFLAENVPGILSPKFDNIRSEAFTPISKTYDMLPPLILNARDYGAPTSRARVFFVGYNKHKVDKLSPELFNPNKDEKLNYVRDAFMGLPVKVYDNATKNSEHVWCKIEKPAPESYAGWLSRTVNGMGNEEAIRRFVEASEVAGMMGTRHSSEVKNRYSGVPPGQSDKISRSFRLQLDGVCPTLRAGTDRNYGSYQAVRPLHPIEGRVITPREAARLQGFPDWFIFHHTKWHSFRQIGNSVSPIIAEHILKVIFNKLI